MNSKDNSGPTSEDEEAPGGTAAPNKHVARSRRFNENIGTFRDVFKIVLIIMLLIAIAIVFFL